MSDFDYGTDEEVTSGAITFVNPDVGDHIALLRSVIHIGLFRETYGKELKPACAEVVAVFELKGKNDFEEDGETPLTISKAFPLKKGDKSFMTGFLKALDPQGKATGFNDVIGKMCTVTAKGGKELNDEGKPKYINFGGISGAPTDPDILEMYEAKGKNVLAVEGVGHVPFADITIEAIMELHPTNEVHNMLMKGEKYEGSKAESLIAEIRKENADFATGTKPKDGDDEAGDGSPNPPLPEPEAMDADPDAEF